MRVKVLKILMRRKKMELQMEVKKKVISQINLVQKMR